MKKKIPGHIKSAFIFSILPDKIRTLVMNQLTDKDIYRLNSGIKGTGTLTADEKKIILNSFTAAVKSIRETKKSIVELSSVISLSILALMLIASSIYAAIESYSINRTILFIENLLNQGGIHLVIFPYAAGMVSAEFKKNPFSALAASQNYIYDVITAITAALVIMGMFLMTTGPGIFTQYNTFTDIFTLIVATTFAPAVEELFFRYYFYKKSGQRLGHIFTAIVSSLLFAAVHIPESFLLFSVYFAAGMIFCGIYYVRKTLFTSFLAHALSNFFLLII